ncbi:MAG: T9SS type A sorting domain-containing protein, partial [Draconibacterium sp.]
LKVLTSVYKAAFRSGSFDVTPGETFTFSIDVMDTTYVSKLRCYFYFRDNCGNELESTSEYSVDSNDWESIVISGTVPGGAVTADVKFKVYDKVGHALFVDNASYREGAGENILPNPYFEYWQDIFAPWIRYDSQTVSNGPEVKVTFSTNGTAGNVYLVPDTLSEYTQASLDALVTEQKANKAALSTDPEQLEIATSSLISGAYKLIIIDGAGNISDEFVACLDIIEFDNVPPVVTAATQEATTSEGQYVLAQSNELGWVYIIMDGEPATRVTELEAAIMAQKGAKSEVGAVDTDTQISTENLADGTYYAYAVDEQFNISLKGDNQIIITYPVGIKDMAEMGVNVYPNPVTNVLNISQAQQINKFVVTNISGQIVESSVNQSSIIQVNTSAYSPGIYFLQIYSKDGATGKLKFVKR